jgi:two-component system sensor histidine kinase AlgZ
MWVLAAVVMGPASHILESSHDFSSSALVVSFLQSLAHNMPWALSAPLFVRLSNAFPIGVGRTVRSIGVFAIAGIVLTPLFTSIAVILARLIAMLVHGTAPLSVLDNIGPPILVTTLFALPKYVALVAIGQTFAYLDRYRQRERLLSETRAEALRAQIAPHFLFNALNSISALGYRDPAKADRAMVGLAGLLRATLDCPAQVAVRDEVAMIADYIALHRLLLENRLAFELDVAPTAWDARMPAMLLQPLIENAIVHGLSRLPEGGMLSLSITHDKRTLRVAIANDAPAAAALAREGIGIGNIRQRLAANYGDRAGLQLERTSGAVRATVHLPLELADS